MNSLKASGQHVFQLCGVATGITAVVDVHAPNVAVRSAVAGNPAAVWVHDGPVISAVVFLLLTLILRIFFHSFILSSSSQCFFFNFTLYWSNQNIK
jgi:hypothetical protein